MTSLDHWILSTADEEGNNKAITKKVSPFSKIRAFWCAIHAYRLRRTVCQPATQSFVAGQPATISQAFKGQGILARLTLEASRGEVG